MGGVGRGNVDEGGDGAVESRRNRRLLIDAPGLLAESLRDRLAEQPGLSPRIVEAPPCDPRVSADGDEADLVLVDAVGTASALTSVRTLCDRWPELDVVVLGVASDDEVVRFVEAGARGYLPLGAGFDELLTTVRSVMSGRTPCEPRAVARVLDRLVRLAGEAAESSDEAPNPLSPRELEVLELVADGLSNKEVAARLGLALSTIKNHVHNLLTKIDVGCRREAVRWAYERGFIDCYLPWRTSVTGSPADGTRPKDYPS